MLHGWERNATSNEPVLRVSNDYGKTFGEKIIAIRKVTRRRGGATRVDIVVVVQT